MRRPSPGLGLGAGGQLVSPAQLPGVVGWWRADQGVTLFGGNVTGWKDQVNGHNLASAGATPTLSASAANGLPSLVFTAASSTYLQGAFTLNQIAQALVVAKWTSSTAAGTVIDGSTGNHGRVFRSAAAAVAIYAGAELIYPTATPQSWHVYAALFSGASSSLTVDGVVQVGPGNAGMNNPGGLTVGAYGGLSDFADVDVPEIILVSPALSAANLSRLGNYLASRYGIAGSW